MLLSRSRRRKEPHYFGGAGAVSRCSFVSDGSGTDTYYYELKIANIGVHFLHLKKIGMIEKHSRSRIKLTRLRIVAFYTDCSFSFLSQTTPIIVKIRFAS
jgi:hypothetical protein